MENAGYYRLKGPYIEDKIYGYAIQEILILKIDFNLINSQRNVKYPRKRLC